jgi:hypothetical protein
MGYSWLTLVFGWLGLARHFWMRYRLIEIFYSDSLSRRVLLLPEMAFVHGCYYSFGVWCVIFLSLLIFLFSYPLYCFDRYVAFRVEDMSLKNPIILGTGISFPKSIAQYLRQLWQSCFNISF